MSKKQNPLCSAINYALVAGVSGLGVSTVGLAQDEGNAELDRIQVTGSRISRSDVEGASPVFVIERADIERTGLTSVGDLLQDLTIAGSSINTQVNNGNSGQTTLDLRNLGANRLLVLLNGRRFVTGLGGVVDLNNIPVAVIKRIEILKDGASSIYGSDAISGVVNILTRDDFEGFQANAQVGQFQSENDGEIQSYDFSIGATSDRGSVFFNASYVQTEAVFAGDRAISAEPQFGTGNAFGSTGTAQGRVGSGVLGTFDLTTDPGADVASQGAAAFRPGDFSRGAPGDGADRFNFAPDNYLLTPQDRTNIFTQGTYDLTDDIRITAEASFNNRSSNQLLAPTPLFLGLFSAGTFAGEIGIGADNPFNPFGIDFNGSSYVLGRRLVEAGPRIFNQEVESYRFGVGVQGSFQAWDRYFDWDLNYVYGETRQASRNVGSVNLDRVQDALSSDCGNGLIDGCVPLNLFGGQGPDGNGTITQEQLDYILFTGNEASGNTLIDYTGNITGELVELPAGPLAFAFGYEHREEEGFDQPDALVSLDRTSGNSRQPTSGGFTVDEFYVELAVPILSGVTGAERLDFSVAARRSDYDTFGDTINSKVGIEWQPIEDLLLRATYSEGFRAPNIVELFRGQADSFPTISDPCSDFLGIQDPAAVQDQNIIDNCVSQGVPADGSYVQPNGQIRITVGSNPNLQPETSESYTFGVVYNPSWIDGLDITVDYYNIELQNAISAVGAQTILNACANNLQLCSLIERGSSVGFVTDILAAGANINSTTVEGVDFLVTYSLPETDFGFFRVSWDAAYQRENSSSTPDFGNPDPNAPPIDQEFIGFNSGDTVFARWKSNVDVNWSYGDWEATYGIQYVHGSDETCGIPEAFGFCNLDTDGDGTLDGRHIGATTYHDAQVSYHFADYDTRVSFGIDNLFDKNPPLSTQAFANSYSARDYRTPGRFPYVRVTVDF